jgi:hypothetical protein
MSRSNDDVIAFGVQIHCPSPDRMTHQRRQAVILITSSSARVHERRTKLGIRRRSIFVHRLQRAQQSQHRSEEMTKRTNISRLKYSTIVLVAVAALMGSAHIAKAKGDHNQGNNSQGNGARPHFVISGQPANVKRVLRTNKKKQMAEKKKKACGNIIVPTAECGVNGSTRPTLPPSQADGSKANPKGPSPAYTTVTLSNGVTTSAIFNGKGLTVTSTSPGTIIVSNGTNTVTMPGGSMNLSGAASVQAGASVQLMRHPNGDVTVAANLAVASAATKPTAGANNGPPGVISPTI